MSQRKRETAERVKQMQAAQRKDELRRRRILVGAVVVLVIAVAVGVGIAVQSSRSGEASGGEAPPGITADNGVYVGKASAPVAVTVYEDFQCPVCKAFEERVGPMLSEQVDQGVVRLEYRPIAFLDRASSTDYSSRALATAACALDDGGPAVFDSLHKLLFTNQPEEGSAGLSDSTLADLAGQAGADKAAVTSCQEAGRYHSWAAEATEAASKAGISGTPTYLVNGEQVTFTDSEDPVTTLTAAIDAANG